MPTMVFCRNCEKRLTGMNIHDAAKMLATQGTLDQCPRCGEPKSIRLEQRYPYPPERSNQVHRFDVTRVVRVFTDEEAEKQDPPFDPMMLFMHELGTENDYVWPLYWTKNRKGKWAWGQFPPVLTLGQLRLLTDERASTDTSLLCR